MSHVKMYSYGQKLNDASHSFHCYLLLLPFLTSYLLTVPLQNPDYKQNKLRIKNNLKTVEWAQHIKALLIMAK